MKTVIVSNLTLDLILWFIILFEAKSRIRGFFSVCVVNLYLWVIWSNVYMWSALTNGTKDRLNIAIKKVSILVWALVRYYVCISVQVIYVQKCSILFHLKRRTNVNATNHKFLQRFCRFVLFVNVFLFSFVVCSQFLLSNKNSIYSSVWVYTATT